MYGNPEFHYELTLLYFQSQFQPETSSHVELRMAAFEKAPCHCLLALRPPLSEGTFEGLLEYDGM